MSDGPVSDGPAGDGSAGDGSAGGGPATDALVRRLDHVAVAVPDLAAAAGLFHDVLGGEFIAGGDDERLRLRTLQLRFPPGVKVELLAPLDETSYLHRYLQRHGPGFHHMTCFVPDVADAVTRLAGAGFEVVDTDLTAEHWRETFIRPSSGFGTLIQLASTDLEWEQPIVPAGATVADVLAGRLLWNAARPHWREDERC